VSELRWICAVGWSLLGIALALRARGGARLTGLLLCALAAAADLLRWHVELWQMTREVLRQLEEYGSRSVVKAAFGVALAAIAVLGWRRLARVGSGPVRLALGCVAGWLLYLLAWTAFLDDVLPAAFARPELRYGLELAAALVGLFSLGRRAG